MTDNKEHYTLLHFWAAYDANSRMQNVLLWNRLNNRNLKNLNIISVSLDELSSVFRETVKADRLESTNQLHEKLGEKSDIFKKYGLKRGLRNFLINNKGIIVAVNVTPDEVETICGVQGA